jgi:hypothetical protein
MITEDLSIVLLSSNQHLVVAKYHSEIQWALPIYLFGGHDYDESDGEIIAAIMLFDEKYGRTPTRKELSDFTITEGHDPQFYGKSDDVLDKLKELPDSSELTEIEPLISSFLDTARRINLRFACRYGSHLATSGATISTREGKRRPATLEDAKAYIMKAIANDLPSAAPEPEGMVHLNTEILRQDLKDALRPKTKDRMYLPWPHVNECVAIRHKYNRNIGIAAYTGHYKTSAAISITYELAKQGFNGLYVTLEVAPRVMWRRFAWLWLCDMWKRKGSTGYPPSEHMWMMESDQITPEQETEMDAAIDEVQQRKFGFGKVDFRNFRTYEDAVVYLKSTHAEEKWDFLVLDYPDLFDQPLSGKNIPGEHQSAINEVFRKILTLCNSFDDNRGLVVFSCLQIKMSGAGLESAKKKKKKRIDDPDPRRYDGVDCIEWYTTAAKAMHFCFSLFKEEDSNVRRVWYDTLKVRDGAEPQSRWLDIDPRSRRVYDHADEWRGDLAAQDRAMSSWDKFVSVLDVSASEADNAA